jgi:hypothetical protein
MKWHGPQGFKTFAKALHFPLETPALFRRASRELCAKFALKKLASQFTRHHPLQAIDRL